MNITDDMIRHELTLIAQSPTAAERTSPRTLYTDEAGDHCVVGAVLDRLGIPLPPVRNFLNGAPVEDLYTFYLLPATTMTPLGVKLLKAAQLTYDDGGSMAQAAQAALYAYEQEA